MTESSRFKIIAVDGGAATGKSSTSRGLSEQLSLMHVDTGAHYRTLTYALLKAGAHSENESDII
ncbi:MAG TPA: cytidylate kinase, partial [Opitutae bacterium]|nr:cytidylate kinase [Opitutae bacterium]